MVPIHLRLACKHPAGPNRGATSIAESLVTLPDMLLVQMCHLNAPPKLLCSKLVKSGIPGTFQPGLQGRNVWHKACAANHSVL